MYIEYLGQTYKVYGTKPGVYENTAFFLIYYESFSPSWKWVNSENCTPI